MFFDFPTSEKRLKKALLTNKADQVMALIAAGANPNKMIAECPDVLTRAKQKNAFDALHVLLSSGKVNVLHDGVKSSFLNTVHLGNGDLGFLGLQERSNDFKCMLESYHASGMDFSAFNHQQGSLIHRVLYPYTQYWHNAKAYVFGNRSLANFQALLELTGDKVPLCLVTKTEDGSTPLHYVAAFRNFTPATEKLFELLVERGASLHEKNKNRDTPLDILSDNEHVSPQFLQKYFPQAKPVSAASETAVGEWYLPTPDEVARQQVFNEMGLRLSDIFNFKLRERISVVQDIATSALERKNTPFDKVSDDVLEAAFDAYAKAGGKITRDVAIGYNSFAMLPSGLRKQGGG